MKKAVASIVGIAALSFAAYHFFGSQQNKTEQAQSKKTATESTITKENDAAYTISKIAGAAYFYPQWSPDGNSIAYTTKEQNGIFVMRKDGSENRKLTDDTGAGYKFVWSSDGTHIAYRGTRFYSNRRIQFIGVVNVADGKTEIVSELHNRLQPPFWQYTQNHKKAGYIIDSKVQYSSPYLYVSANNIKANEPLYLHYKDEHLYLLENNNQFRKLVKGFDPVISPDGKKFVYSKWNQLSIFSFEDNTELILDEGYSPSWSPDGLKIVYQKTKDDEHSIIESDLYIFDLNEQKSLQLTKTSEIMEANPQWHPKGKHILFNDDSTGELFLLHLK